MPAQLRIASHDRNAAVVAEGVRCGMEFCGAVLGDLISLGGIQYVSLLDGYRKEKTGDYKLHRHVAWRNRRDKPPKDAHPRRSGVADDGHYGPIAQSGESSLFPEIPRERLPTRERVKGDQLQVSCLACGYSNTLDGNALQSGS